jgi:adenosylcobinamide-GDP ribazoletransferase
MKVFLIALQFLTILPIRLRGEIRKEDFGKALLYFPAVGLLIGLVLFTGAFVFSFLPALVKAALILLISFVITGGLHLDGLADTCDGLLSNKPREEILKVMDDSHIGTMGVAAVALVLLLKFSLLAGIPEAFLGKALILLAVFSRWIQVLACFSSSYARQDGKAKYFIEYATEKELFIGLLFTLILFYLFLNLRGLILFLFSLICVFLFLHWIKRKIGGMTGDTIGALSEIAEIFVLFFALILSR